MRSVFVLCLVAIAALTAHGGLLKCQMLMSPEEQTRMGYDRQRRMYPPERAKRLAAQAAAQGMKLMERRDLAGAMAEFNRAWRFCPDDPYCYWMGGIVRGIEALNATDPALRSRAFQESLRLFDEARKRLDGGRIELENLALDRAETLICYGEFLQSGRSPEAARYLDEAESILTPFARYRKLDDRRSRQITSRADDQLKRLRRARERRSREP